MSEFISTHPHADWVNGDPNKLDAPSPTHDRTYLYGFEDDEYLEYDAHEALEKRWDQCDDPANLVGRELCEHTTVPPSSYLSVAEYIAEMLAERADGDLMEDAYEAWSDALQAPEAIAIIEEMRTKLGEVVDRNASFRMADKIVRRLPIGQTEDGKYLTLDGEPTNFEIHLRGALQ